VTAPPPDGPSRRWSIRYLFINAIAAALVPVCLISFVQAYARLERDREVVRAGLTESAQAIGGAEQNILAIAEHVVRAVALIDEVRIAGPACSLALKSALVGIPELSNFVRVDAAGRIVCGALPVLRDADVSNEAWWIALDRRAGFRIHGPIFGQMSQRPILLGIQTLVGPDGRFDGTLNVSVDLVWLDAALKSRPLEDGSVIALLASDGAVIASSAVEGLPAFGRPADAAGDGVRTAADPGGAIWSFAVAPLVADDIYVAFATPNERLYASTVWQVGIDIVLPLVAVALASLAIWLAVDRWIVRGVGDLRRLSAAYARGHYRARSSLIGDAPAELQALGEDLHNMAAQARERDTRLKEALAQKELMVREIHHRVKNNLQIVMSLISLQAGRIPDPEVRRPLEMMRTRVGALALVHRLLLEMEDQRVVDVRHLFRELSDHLRRAFAGQGRDVTLSCEAGAALLDTDVATPLTLFMVEAVTNAFRHAYPPGRKGEIRLTFDLVEGKGRLIVADDGVGYDPATAPVGAGRRLLSAFAQQLAGECLIEAVPGAGVTATLVFPLPPEAVPGSPPA